MISFLSRRGLAVTTSTLLIAVLPTVGVAQTLSPMVRASVQDAGSAPGGIVTSARPGSDAKTLHVTVGHSIFLDTKTRLRRVYVADPAVLNSVTLTPNEIIVTAMQPGVSSLTLLDEGGQAQSYVISSDIDIDGLRSAMTQAMRGNNVKVDGSGASVTLSGTVPSDAAADSALKLASLYSKVVGNALTVVPGHPKQVRLQVRILEVDRTKALQLGVNLFNPGGNTSFLAGTTTQQYPSTMTYAQSSAGNLGGGLITTTNPLNFMLYSSKLNLGATIQDLQTKQVLQILAEPTITTLSGKKADFLSGGEFPFPIVQPGSGANSAPVITIQFRAYGVKVEFTPIVNEDGTIRLTVAPEVSALDYTNAVTISGFTVPALSTRRAETEVELRSDQSFAISGLLDQRTTDLMSKNPGAASIPILGYLFKSKNMNHSTTELVVVVTPTLVDPLIETAPPAEPALPIRTLDTKGFDDSLGKNLNPNPAPPAINPDKPVFGYQAPAAPVPPAANAPAVTAAAAKTQGATATAAPQSTAVAAQPKPQPAASPQSPAAAVQAKPQPVATSPSTAVAASTKPQAAATPAPQRTATPAVSAGPVPPAAPRATPAAPTAQTAPAAPAAVKPAAAPAATPVAAAKPLGPTQIVEVMAVSHASDAEAAVAALSRRGYNVAVNHDPQNSLLHLDIGPFSSAKDAETMRQRLLRDGYNATIK